MLIDTGAHNDNLTERICPALDWRVRALGLLGISTSEVSSNNAVWQMVYILLC
jgi:hypothetical protein